MRINRKKSSPINPQSPPQEMSSTTKNKSQKNTKDQASKSISQSTITTHVKRAVEGITSKIEKNSIERIIADAETDEGCDCLMKSFIDVFDNNSNNDTIILKSLEVIYILLHTSNSTFRTKMQYIMPEILTITTLNFKKSKVKFRNSVHELAKAIYLNLQRRIPLPSPSQLELPENFPQFIPINSGSTAFHSNFNENKFSFDFENENDNRINNDADNNIDEIQDITKEDVISNLVDSSPKQESSFKANNNDVTISLIDKDKNDVPDKNNLDVDLIDCENADDGLKESANIKLSNNTILNNDKDLNIEIDNSRNHPSKAKQALDDYLKNSEQEDGNNNNNVIQHQNSDNKESYDNLLLMPDDSFDTSSSVIYSSANINDQNNNDLNNNDSKNIVENLLETDPISISKPRRQKKNFNISKKEKGDNLLSPNIPRSQSLNVNMPIIIDQSSNSNLIPGSQLQNNQNTNSHDLIDSNQIIDLTKPASTPNSPTSSLMNPTQNSFLDSILNSQPNTTPANNYNSPSTFNPPSPSTFNPPSPSDFNSPDSTSNYNSESTSNFLLNSNQYSSQLSKSNSIFNSNIELGSQASLNSVSDSILKIPSRELISPSKSSGIQMLDSPSKFNSNLSFNKTNDSSTLLQTDDKNNTNVNNIHLNATSETKKPSSSRFSVKYEHLSPNSLLQKEENNIQKNATQQKTKFKIEKRVSSPQSDNSINISQADNQASTSSAYAKKQDLFNNFESDNTSNFTNTTSNNFSSQDLFNSSVQTSTYDDFQASRPSFGLEDFDDRFEPITPVQSSNIQIFNDIDNNNDNKNNKSQIVSPSIITSSETNDSAENDQFITLTPKRSDSINPQSSNGIDDRFVPITPIHTSNLDNSNDVKNTNNDNNGINNNNGVGAESDDQFVPITPVRNSLPFIDDDELFAKSKSEGGSFNSDQFVPITPVKNNSLFSEDDQFVPITPVKNTIDPLFDDSTSSVDKMNNTNDNKKNGSLDQFVPISPADKDIISFSDDAAQAQNNNKTDSLIDDLVSIPKSNNNNNDQSQSLNSNSDNSLYDQFVPISPVAESIIPIFNSQNLDSNDDSNLQSIMRAKKNNIINNSNNNINNIMGISPRSRRHLSFDSGIFSPGSDKFEAITPPNARSMFYINQNNNNNNINIKNETNEKTMSTSNSKNDSKMTDSSFIDQFEPITPPSSLRNQSQIDDLINSNGNNNGIIFNQTNKNESKFDENLDKKINTQNNTNGNHHLVSFEITKQRKNSGEQQNELRNFPLIDSDLNSANTNSEINFQSLTNNFSKSHENLKSENNTSVPSSNKSQNPIDFKIVGSKNNQAKRFNVYIEHAQSSQNSTTDNT